VKVDKTQLQRVRDQLPRASNGISGWTLTCYQALFSFRSVTHVREYESDAKIRPDRRLGGRVHRKQTRCNSSLFDL